MYRETHTHWPSLLTVWSGILGNQIDGPLYLNTNLISEVYHDMVENTIEPLIL